MFKYFPFIKNDFLIVLRNDKAESLLYLFPLIERIIVEILSLEPNSDIEHYSQGTYRTMNEILNKNKDILTELLGYEIYQSLCYLYIDNNNNKSLRNQIFHIKATIRIPSNVITEVKSLAIMLLMILESMLTQREEIVKKHIEILD